MSGDTRAPGVPWAIEPLPGDPFADVEPDRCYVFTPAIMSFGLVFSLIALARDALRWTGGRARRRRTAIEARAVVNDLLGVDEPEPDDAGLFPRPAYLLAAVLLGSASLIVALAGLVNFFQPDGEVRDIAWLLAIATIASVVLGHLAAVSMAVFIAWPGPPPWVFGTLRAVPLGATPGHVGHGPGWLLTAALVASASILVAVTVLVETGEGIALQIDEPIVDLLTGVGWLRFLGPFDPFGSTLVTIGFVVLIGLSGFRCRVMAVVYPAAFVVAWSTVELLQRLVHRPRPSGIDGFESFPSGHIVQVVFIAGLLPQAVGVLLVNRRAEIVSRVVLGVAVVATAVHRVHLAKHWPLDILGGLAIGATVVLAARWVLGHRLWHRQCPTCPWSAHPGLTPWQRGVISFSPEVTRRISRAGAGLALLAAVALVGATFVVGLPSDPEGAGLGESFTEPIQLGLAAAMALGGILTFRWKHLAAFVMAFAATGLGLFAAIEYAPELAFALTVLLLVPAFVTWLGWQPTETLGNIAALAVVTVSVLTATGLGVREVHGYYFGPTHPESLAVPLDSDASWLWVGGVGSSTATVTAGGLEAGTVAEIHAWNGDRSPAIVVRSIVDGDGLARFDIDGLAPGAEYSYAIDNGGSSDPPGRSSADGEFRTFEAGSQDLEVLVGACARRGSNGGVFDAMVAEDADLYLMVGDLHYADLSSSDPSDHLREYERALSRPGQSALFRSVPSAYVWDDHDYGENDADRSSPSRSAVSTAYRLAVPHYGVDPDPEASIAQAFSVGRVRFVMTDTRSQRTAVSMLGDAQVDWLIDELTSASRTHALVVWASPTPWIGEATDGADDWSGYPGERRRIADAIAAAGIQNLVMVTGDAHMLAIDDGSNSGYAADGTRGFPVLNAAALDRRGAIKGGPYSHGAFPGGGQYGVVEIADDGGDTVVVRLAGRTWTGETIVELELDFAVNPAITAG